MEQQISLKYIGYARRSSDDNKERQAASLPDQVYILEGIKAKHSLNVIDIVIASESAFVKGRKDFNSIIERIEKGEANALLAWHENRLARNAYDAGQIIDLMDNGKLVEVRTPGRIYHNTPGDKFMLQIELASSKKDSDDKSIVVMRGLEKKAREGFRPGVAPVGYLNDKTTESGFRRIFIDLERFSFVKKIFELFHTGTSVVEIHRIAKDEWHFTTRQKKRSGGKPLSISMIYAILTNSFYCGRFEYPLKSGKWYEGQYEIAVSLEVFEEIQLKLGRRSQYKLQHQDYAYSALMRCKLCDSAVIAERKLQCICTNCKFKFSLTKKNKDRCTDCGTLIENMTNPQILHYIYYRCGKKKNPQCKERGLRIDKFEDQIENKLSQVEISPLFLNWAVEQIQKMNENDKSFSVEKTEGFKRAHNSCKVRLNNLLQLKISPENSDGSLLNDGQYKEQKVVLENEFKTIESQIAMIDTSKVNDQVKQSLSFASLAKERFKSGDNKRKRDIFMGLGLHPTMNDKIIQFNSPKYIQIISEMKKVAPVIGDRVAPKDQIDLKPQMDNIFASIPALLRGQELRLAYEIMLSVFSSYLECRTISSSPINRGARRLVSTGSLNRDFPRYCPE